MNNTVQAQANGDFKVLPLTQEPAPAVTIEDGKRVFNSESFYLEYCNIFYNVEAIADHYMIAEKHAENLINWGRQLNHKRKGLKTDRQFLGI